MGLSEFLLTVVLVTASGALAPGPLFVATILQGTKSGARGGFACALGHTAGEFPLVLLMAHGLYGAAPALALYLRLAGGAALVIFGGLQVRAGLSKRVGEGRVGAGVRGPFVVGLLLTILNPFFILWWLTVGAKLVWDAIAFASIGGVLIMYLAHVWLDYAWLSSVAQLAGRGRRLMGWKVYKALVAILGAVLIAFGLYFLFAS